MLGPCFVHDTVFTGLDKQNISAKNCKFLTHNLSIYFGCSKEPSH